MASNVFGSPITNETLKKMSKYESKYDCKGITAVDRAYEALIMKNADNKDVNARSFVESLQQRYVATPNPPVSTLCLIYNATGNKLTYVTSHDFAGHIGHSPYPTLLQNGQWGAFLHIQTIGQFTGSIGSITYRGQDQSGTGYDWTFFWENPGAGPPAQTQAHTEIRQVHRSEEPMVRRPYNEGYYNRLEKCKYASYTLNKCYSTAIIGHPDQICSNRICPIFEGIMTLEDAWIRSNTE